MTVALDIIGFVAMVAIAVFATLLIALVAGIPL